MDRTSRTLKTGEILDVLNDSYRRPLLHTLKDHDDDLITFDEAPNTFVEAEADHTENSVVEDLTIVTLVHHHDSQLKEAGLVDYDIGSEEIRHYLNERVETAL